MMRRIGNRKLTFLIPNPLNVLSEIYRHLSYSNAKRLLLKMKLLGRQFEQACSFLVESYEAKKGLNEELKCY